MRLLERVALIGLVVLLSVGCDQGTKALAGAHLISRGTISLLGDTVRLHYAENTGALLSLGAQLPAAARFWVFTVLVGLMLLAVLFVAVWHRRLGLAEVVALSLIAGGGASNLIDRIANDGVVIDFLNLGIAHVRTGIFNLADVAVFAGVGILWLHYLRRPETRTEVCEPEEDADQLGD